MFAFSKTVVLLETFSETRSVPMISEYTESILSVINSFPGSEHIVTPFIEISDQCINL